MAFNFAKFQELRAVALSKRKFGRLTVECQLLSEFRSAELGSIDEFLKQHGFTGSHADLKQIDRQKAVLHAARVLSRDLAYGAEMMTSAEAEQIASSFLSFFEPSNPRFFTNCVKLGDCWAGNPISDSTFDEGVIAINDEAIGILWAQDED